MRMWRHVEHLKNVVFDLATPASKIHFDTRSMTRAEPKQQKQNEDKDKYAEVKKIIPARPQLEGPKGPLIGPKVPKIDKEIRKTLLFEKLINQFQVRIQAEPMSGKYSGVTLHHFKCHVSFRKTLF